MCNFTQIYFNSIQVVYFGLHSHYICVIIVLVNPSEKVFIVFGKMYVTKTIKVRRPKISTYLRMRIKISLFMHGRSSVVGCPSLAPFME